MRIALAVFEAFFTAAKISGFADSSGHVDSIASVMSCSELPSKIHVNTCCNFTALLTGLAISVGGNFSPLFFSARRDVVIQPSSVKQQQVSVIGETELLDRSARPQVATPFDREMTAV